MATDSYWQLEKEYYSIATDHDLIVRVIEHNNVTRTDSSGEEVVESLPIKVHEFKVKRAVLVDSSDYFRKLLEGPFIEAQQTAVPLLEDSAEGLHVWFSILHNANLEVTHEHITIRGVWETLAAAHKYGLDPKSSEAKTWFKAWWAARLNTNKDTVEAGKKLSDFEKYQQLLFPCYAFDHATGFQTATKYLAYHAKGHITERRPEGFKLDHLHCDSNVIQQVNAAKGRLKTILHRALYKPIDGLLKYAECDCKANVLYAYEQGLSNTTAWPLESAYLSHSMNEILKKLDKFSGSQAKTCGGSWCGFSFKGVVDEAQTEATEYFDGLCLDCMNASKPKFGDADKDYWHHADQGVQWDSRCRIHHGQPSWYFSFMGRRQKMIAWTQRSRVRRG